MAQEQSLADQLVFFLRMRDEASTKIDAMPHDGNAWPQLGIMLEQQERTVRDALVRAAMAADRLGRLADCMTKAEDA
jgi:hypothetical protein